MKRERENSLSKAKPLNTVSPKSSGDTKTNLSQKEYDISGNQFTAYYDGASKLVFILDKTLDDRKPNVLLIINPIGDRKWDDILANDFGLDLETIRPKVDNKYQKLDIEYSGLGVYDRLINDFKNGDNLKSVLGELSDFRNASVKRAAADRLIAATDVIKKTRETISKTGETMRELQSRLKKLRDKLSRQKKEVGKEPTKQSAAKILKTESQIDATNEKLKRAKRRLKNAQRRLSVAEEDAEIARKILNKKEEFKEIKKEEPKVKEMAEDVKPLFDQDPKIMDQGIAFKPIDFSIAQKTEQTVKSETVVEKTESVQFKPVEVPLSFVPPIIGNTVVEEPKPAVVQPVPEPVQQIIVEQPRPAPVLESITPIPTPQPVPEINARPVSPIVGPEQMSINTHKHPNALYYLMLIALIILSMFTLWMYQKHSANTVPELSKPASEVVFEQPKAEVKEEIQQVESETSNPFIQVQKIEPEVEAPVVEDTQQPAPVIVSEPEPQVIAEPQQDVTQPVAQAQEYEDNLILPMERQPSEEVVPVQPAPSPEIESNKPAYDVSDERRFVADENYQQDSSSYNNHYSE